MIKRLLKMRCQNSKKENQNTENCLLNLIYESDKSTIANTILSSYISKLDISQRINFLVVANEFSSAVEELIKINRYKEAVMQ